MSLAVLPLALVTHTAVVPSLGASTVAEAVLPLAVVHIFRLLPRVHSFAMSDVVRPPPVICIAVDFDRDEGGEGRE